MQELTSRSNSVTQHLTPRSTNTYNIGGASSVYANGYFQNAITVVSDRDHKPIEEDVPDNILDIWGSISPKRYKYDWAIEEKGVEGARWHVGWIAQDILEAFAKAGEDATEWALITYNEWDESEEVPAGHQWRLVMDECLAMEALYQRRRLSKIEDAIA
ncbi:tail fiber domain-containing protein [Kluyvera intermedia]|uniref:tail fiber domain-containing protein n=1 Tax=Kluyvera intermedia TaxID=61648 RepID=UPI0039F47AC5